MAHLIQQQYGKVLRMRPRWLLGKLADDKSAGAIRPILLKMAENDPDAKVRNNALWALYFFPGIPTNDYWNTLRRLLTMNRPNSSNGCVFVRQVSQRKIWAAIEGIA